MRFHKKIQPAAVTVRVDMTDEMKTDRDRHVGIVKSNLAAFATVAQSLLHLWKNKLYSDHKDFGEFCQHHFGFDYKYAKRLINSSAVVTMYRANGGTLPIANEAQARAMATAKSTPIMLKAMEIVEAKNVMVTAEVISASVKEATFVIGFAMKHKKSGEGTTLDVARALEAGKIVLKAVADIRIACKVLDEFSTGEFGLHVPQGQLTNQIKAMSDKLRLMRPYADCVYCGMTGCGDPVCSGCNGCGWLTKTQFDAAPPDLQALSIVIDE